MRHPLASLSILCLFLPGCHRDHVLGPPEPGGTLQGQWSEPVDGLSCRIALAKDTLHVGTLSIFQIELKNTSDAPIDLAHPARDTGQRGRILLTRDGETYDERNFLRPLGDTAYYPPGPPVGLGAGQALQAYHAILIDGQDFDGVAKLNNAFGHRPEYPLKALNDWDGFPELPTGEYQLQYRYNDSVVSPPLSVEVARPAAGELVYHVLAEARTEGLPAKHRQTLVEVLGHLTCRQFDATEQLDSLAAFEAWWADHRDEPWQEWILSALEGDDPAARERAANRSYLIRDKAYHARLANHLDPTANASYSIFLALWQNFQDPSADYAREILEAESSGDKHYLLYLIQTHKITPLHPMVIERLAAESDPAAQGILIDRARWMSIPQAESAIEELMEREELAVIPRARGIYALSYIKGTDYEPQLLEFVKSDEVQLRLVAVWALHHAGTARAVEPLIAALSDEDKKVQTNACFALENSVHRHMTHEQRRRAADIIWEMMNDPDNPYLEDPHYGNSLKNARNRIRGRWD